MPLDSNKITALEKIFRIKSKYPEHFEKALTHSSYTREKEINALKNYERLEFLGDAVLKLCISEILYKIFPEYQEGELTKIRSIVVSDISIAQVAEEIGLAQLIILGSQEEKTGGRKKTSILACAFEAVLGAYYLEGKYNEILLFLEEIFTKLIKDVNDNFEKFNAKAALQEYTQSKNKQTPKYKIIEEIGPEHDKIFIAEVSYKNEVLALGKGKTKKDAEQAGAYKACVKLGVIK